MASKKTNFWYILVLTDNGAKFVTETKAKWAKWDENGKPLEFTQSMAKEIAKGLMLNFHMAFPVCAPFELDTQPYRYSDGHFEWVENEKGVDNTEEK